MVGNTANPCLLILAVLKNFYNARDGTCVSCVSCINRWIPYLSATWGALFYVDVLISQINLFIYQVIYIWVVCYSTGFYPGTYTLYSVIHSFLIVLLVLVVLNILTCTMMIPQIP